MVRRQFRTLAMRSSLILAALAFTSLATMGAGPRQDGVPPQPFFPDSISGSVTLQGKPGPTSAKLVACIDDCSFVFESSPVLIASDGSFSELLVNPEDQRLVGHEIEFYLVNEFGRIRAAETITFQGGPEIHTAKLTFSQPMPVPTPTPTLTPTAALPAPGDPVVAVIPRYVLMAGALVVAAGVFLLFLARRRTI